MSIIKMSTEQNDVGSISGADAAGTGNSNGVDVVHDVNGTDINDIIPGILNVTKKLADIKFIDEDVNIRDLINTIFVAPKDLNPDTVYEFEQVRESIFAFLRSVQDHSNKDYNPHFVYNKKCIEDDDLFNSDNACVKEIIFDVSRDSEIKEHLVFDTLKTPKDAIMLVEEYLSVPVTKEYYDKNKQGSDLDFEDLNVRGDLLGDMFFLEELMLENGVLAFYCGS
jgi:hypothetical protein